MNKKNYENKQEQTNIEDKYLIPEKNEIEDLFYEEIDAKIRLYRNNKNRAWIDATF